MEIPWATRLVMPTETWRDYLMERVKEQQMAT